MDSAKCSRVRVGRKVPLICIITDKLSFCSRARGPDSRAPIAESTTMAQEWNMRFVTPLVSLFWKKESTRDDILTTLYQH